MIIKRSIKSLQWLSELDRIHIIEESFYCTPARYRVVRMRKSVSVSHTLEVSISAHLHEIRNLKNYLADWRLNNMKSRSDRSRYVLLKHSQKNKHQINAYNSLTQKGKIFHAWHTAASKVTNSSWTMSFLSPISGIIMHLDGNYSLYLIFRRTNHGCSSWWFSLIWDPSVYRSIWYVIEWRLLVLSRV